MLAACVKRLNETLARRQHAGDGRQRRDGLDELLMSIHGPRSWSEAEDKRLMRMYREGYEPRVVAEALGRPVKTISERRRKLLDDE